MTKICYIPRADLLSVYANNSSYGGGINGFMEFVKFFTKMDFIVSPDDKSYVSDKNVLKSIAANNFVSHENKIILCGKQTMYFSSIPYIQDQKRANFVLKAFLGMDKNVLMYDPRNNNYGIILNKKGIESFNTFSLTVSNFDPSGCSLLQSYVEKNKNKFDMIINTDIFEYRMEGILENPYKTITTLRNNLIPTSNMSSKEYSWYSLLSDLEEIEGAFNLSGYRRLTYFDENLYRRGFQAFMKKVEKEGRKKLVEKEEIGFHNQVRLSQLEMTQDVFTETLGVERYSLANCTYRLLDWSFYLDFQGVEKQIEMMSNWVGFDYLSGYGHGALFPHNILYNKDEDKFAYINPNLELMNQDLVMLSIYDQYIEIVFSTKVICNLFTLPHHARFTMNHNGSQNTMSECRVGTNLNRPSLFDNRKRETRELQLAAAYVMTFCRGDVPQVIGLACIALNNV